MTENKKTKIGNNVKWFALGGILAAVPMSIGVADKNLDLYDRNIEVSLKNRDVEVPVYNIFDGLKPFRCSSYVRKVAGEIFPEIGDYSWSDAWDRPSNDELVSEVRSFRDIDRLYADGIVKEGMVVGVRVPGSSYNDRGAYGFGHNILLLGENKEGEEMYAHQWGTKTHIHSSRDLENFGFEPVVVVKPKRRK